MRNGNLNLEDPPKWKSVRGFAFIAAIGIGVYIGWKDFLSPQEVVSAVPNPRGTVEVDPTALISTTSDLMSKEPVPGPGSIARAGYLAPDFTLEDLYGIPHSLFDHRHQVVLINFWTTWCPPCRKVMPALQEAHIRFQDQGFIVLGVNWTEVDNFEEIGPYIQELGLTFPILMDLNSVVAQDQYRLLGLPTSVFIGRDGIIRTITVGALKLEDLESTLQSLLEESQ
jgi:thiol-disulfide isomerase/thioredoxin